MKIRENISLIVGIALPILMILFIIGSIYLPQAVSEEEPEYDFLYMSQGAYGPGEAHYYVRDGRLVREEIQYPENSPRPMPPQSGETRFFVYDVSEHENREVDFEEASRFMLDSSNRSPDGFEVVYGTRADFPFFIGRDYDRRFLKGSHYSKELELVTIGDIHRGMYGVTILGWIVGEDQNPTPGNDSDVMEETSEEVDQ